MSTLLVDPQLELEGLSSDDGEDLFVVTSLPNVTDTSGRLTLDDMITGVWEGLSLAGIGSCPACGGTMRLRRAARTDLSECACRDCGASLS